MSMNGNTTRIDGAVNYYGWLPYLIAYVPPPDSIENVSITTDDFTAEQGQAGGASIKISTKSGSHDFHGSAWWYYQDASINARPYTTTTGVVPKNVFDEFGGDIGGPVYLPKILTGRKKLFFFDNWERTTDRKAANGNPLTVPDTNMIGGNFSEAASLTTLYDPQPTAAWVASFTPTANCPTLTYTAGYLNYNCRPTFTSEYGETGNNVNSIPTSRQSTAAQTMIANLSKIAASIGTPSASQISNFMNQDYASTASAAQRQPATIQDGSRISARAVGTGQIDEKDFGRALAHQLGRELGKIVGRGDQKPSDGGPPRQQSSEHALRQPAVGRIAARRGKRLLDLVDPQHGRRHRLGLLQGLAQPRLALADKLLVEDAGVHGTSGMCQAAATTLRKDSSRNPERPTARCLAAVPGRSRGRCAEKPPCRRLSHRFRLVNPPISSGKTSATIGSRQPEFPSRLRFASTIFGNSAISRTLRL